MKYRVPIFAAVINNITTMKKIIVFPEGRVGSVYNFY